MIQINDLDYSYNSSSFRLSISALTVEQGEKVAIVGPSGSGKSTLLRLVAGAVKPQRGMIRLGDARIDQLSDSQRRAFRIANIGFVFQEFELLDYLTVNENILLPFYINRALRLSNQTRLAAQELAVRVGLAAKLKRRPDQLSQGERQRVAVCRALITRPKVLLADEPTGSLDRQSAGEILDLLLAQAASEGTTVLFVTHDHSLLPQFNRTIDMVEFQIDTPEILEA